MGELITWDWVPLISVGPFELGSLISDCENRIRSSDNDSKESANLIYEIKNTNSRLTGTDGRISKIHCYDELLITHKNIIGLTEIDVIDFLPPGGEELITPQIKYIVYHEQGLILQVVNDVVESVDVGRAIVN